MQALGQGQDARRYFEKSLAIAQRLAAAEPNRADLQTDLVVSLVRVGSREALVRAPAILEPLEQRGALTARQAQWPTLIRQALAEATETP